MFGVSGTLRAAEGRGDDLERQLLEAAGHLEAVTSCHLYLVSRVENEPDTLHVMEVWDDEEAHRASLQLAAVQELISRARPIIAGMGDRLELRPAGGKGFTRGG